MTLGTGRTLRGAVCGLGTMGSHHLRILNQLPGVEVIAVADPDPQRHTEVLTLGRGCAAFRFFSDLLDSVEIDFVALAAPAHALPELAAQAIHARVAALVEKPLSPSEDAAAQTAEVARQAGVDLCVGYVERFNPAISELKRRLDDGGVGRVYEMQARRLSPFPDRDSLLGVSLDLATHDIDVMRYLTGAEVSRVYAETQSRLHDRAEELLCATLQFDDGVTGLLEVNWLTPAKVRTLSVTGEAGMFVVDYITQELCLYEHPHAETTHWSVLAGMRGRGEGDMIRFALERREPLVLEWLAFLDAVRSGNPPSVRLADGVAALSVACAIQQSGKTHTAVVPRYYERLR